MNQVKPNRDYALVNFQVGLGDASVAIHMVLATETQLAQGVGEEIIVRITPEMAKVLSRNVRDASKAAALGKAPTKARQ